MCPSGRETHTRPLKNMIAPKQLQADTIDNVERGKKRMREAFRSPLCLIRNCREQGRRHFPRNCEISDEKARDMLLEQSKKNKKAQHYGQKDTGNIEK